VIVVHTDRQPLGTYVEISFVFLVRLPRKGKVKIFALLGDCFTLGSFLLQKKPNFLVCLFLRKKLCINFDKNMGWAKFWAGFSKPHPVTQPTINNRRI
jgi:hypothetical protein